MKGGNFRRAISTHCKVLLKTTKSYRDETHYCFIWDHYSHIVAKFQIDRFRAFGESRNEKNKEIKKSRRINHILAWLLRYALFAGGVKYNVTRLKRRP